MDVINKDLLKSLSQDIRKINEINDDIILYLDSCDQYTWFLSCKDENEVLDNINLQKASDVQEQYLSTLELVIDRIYLFLNSLLRFVETEYFEKDPLANKYIVRPKNLTLGTTVKMLWQQLNDCKSIVNCDRKENEKFFKCPKLTQTEISTFSNCYTCTNVNYFVKRIVELFEKRLQIPSFVQEKENVRRNIYDLTQHSCVERLLNEIERSMQKLGDENATLRVQIEKVNVIIEEKDYDFLTLNRDYNKLKDKCDEVGENFQKEKEKYNKLLEKYNDTFNKKRQLEKSLEEQSTTMASVEDLMYKVQDNASALEIRKNELEKELDQMRISNKSLAGEKDMWKQRFIEQNNENQDLKRNISNTHSTVKAVKMHLSKVNANYQELNGLLSKSTSEYQNTVTRYNGILHKLKDLVAEKLTPNNETLNKCPGNMEVDIKIEGNPLADMTNQVKANQTLIEKLEKKNDHLLKIIRSLKKIDKC